MAESGDVTEVNTNIDNDEFNFDTWANNLKLPRKVTQCLRSEELYTKETLKLVEAKCLKELGLPLGSIKLILKQVGKWNGDQETNKTTTPATCTVPGRPNADVLAEAGKTLDFLLGDEISPSKVDYTLSAHMDPRAILTMKATSRKAIHITQFLTEKCKRRRQNRRKEFVLRSGQSNQETLILKTEEEHPYLGIYVEEWGAANMRLMNYLLNSGQLKRDDIEFYLAYTTKVFEFADIYEWSSVLNFDYTYRELQSEHDFQWGTFSPHMELQLLISKRIKHGSELTSANVQKQQQEDFRIFKAKGVCPFGSNCRYRHARQHQQTPRQTTGSPPANGINYQKEA